MHTSDSPTLAFDDFVLDTALPELRYRGQRVELQRKPMNLLVYIALRHDRIVPLSEVLEHVWPGVVVSDAAVRSALKAVRSALHDDGRQQRTIRTRKGYGVQLVAPVRVLPGAAMPTRVSVTPPRWPDGFVERLALFLHSELAAPEELSIDAMTPHAGVFLGAAARLANVLSEPALGGSP